MCLYETCKSYQGAIWTIEEMYSSLWTAFALSTVWSLEIGSDLYSC